MFNLIFKDHYECELLIYCTGLGIYDSYNNKGINPNSLTNSDKLSYVNILKSEFINDIPN